MRTILEAAFESIGLAVVAAIICFFCFEISAKVKRTFKNIDRLAAYENTGLEPNQISAMMAHNTALIEQLAEYQRLEEQDLLLKLPCRKNEWVWVAHETRKCAYEVLYTCKSNILADMEAGFVFGYTKAEVEEALKMHMKNK